MAELARTSTPLPEACSALPELEPVEPAYEFWKHHLLAQALPKLQPSVNVSTSLCSHGKSARIVQNPPSRGNARHWKPQTHVPDYPGWGKQTVAPQRKELVPVSAQMSRQVPAAAPTLVFAGVPAVPLIVYPTPVVLCAQAPFLPYGFLFR